MPGSRMTRNPFAVLRAVEYGQNLLPARFHLWSGEPRRALPRETGRLTDRCAIGFRNRLARHRRCTARCLSLMSGVSFCEITVMIRDVVFAFFDSQDVMKLALPA